MTRRKLLVRVIFGLLLYVMVEAVSSAGLLVLRRSRGVTWFPAASRLDPRAVAGIDSLRRGSRLRVVLDSVLGWRAHREITPQGVRDDREHSADAAPGVLRIAAFGDSFTYGSDVALNESWLKRMSAVDSSVEILNFGVGAYGLDQGYLRYLRDGRRFHPHVVFIGYMSENLARDVNVFRGFYGNGYRDFIFSKPRFKLAGGKLELIPNPLRSVADYGRLRDNQRQVLAELGRNDFYYASQYGAGRFDFSPTVRLVKLAMAQVRKSRQVPAFDSTGMYETRSEAYAVTLRIFDAYYRKVLEDGALPVIVVFPDVNDQQRSRAGLSRRYAPLLQHFDSSGYRYVDILAALEPVQSKYSLEDLSQQWGHFTALANDLAARFILASMEQGGLHDVGAVAAAAASERERLGIVAGVIAPEMP